MDTNTNNNDSEFNSADDAFEYLINEHLDDKRKEEWTEAFNKNRPEGEVSKSNNIRKLYIKVASIAAGIIVLIGAFWMTQDMSGSTDVMAQNYINETAINLNYSDDTRALESTPLSNEISENITGKLTEALVHKDYSQILGIYRTLEKKMVLPIRDKYYFAICLLKTDKEDKYKAIRLLDEVILNDKNLEAEALYFRGLANVLTGNKLEAEADFTTLQKKSNYKKDVINKILDQLNH